MNWTGSAPAESSAPQPEPKPVAWSAAPPPTTWQSDSTHRDD
jgi:hypothetical protein